MSDPVAQFEERFAAKLGGEYAIAVNSGTSALHAALEAINVRHGEVILPALVPGLVAFAVIHAGAWPIFADVDPQTQLVTPQTLDRVVGSRTKAVIAVALHGLPVDIDSIMSWAKSRGIFVIEDCAQCLLGRYKDVFAGTKADLGCFSFERKKHITTGSEGGMILTSSAGLAERARKFAGLGYRHLTASQGRTELEPSELASPAYLRYDTIGLNYRMSHIQAEAGLQALKTMQDKVWTRQEIGYYYQHALGCQLQPHVYDADNTFYSAAWASPFGLVVEWKAFHREFCAAGGDGFYAMTQVPCDEPALEEFKGVSTPVASDLQGRLICFKTHYSLEEARRQISILETTLEKYRASLHQSGREAVKEVG